MKNNLKRCTWTHDNPFNNKYHDEEWGVPVHDDFKLFEFLILDGFQAGLSWLTILKKRDNFRSALDNFDFVKIAQYNQSKIDELMANQGIIRNKLKIDASIKNAESFIKIRNQFGSFDNYIWRFVNGKPIINTCKSWEETPTRSLESDKMSKDLQHRGFKFVGTTICYAFMQAAGLVNDHEINCYRYHEIIKNYQ